MPGAVYVFVGSGDAVAGSPEWLKGTARPLLRSPEVVMSLPVVALLCAENKYALL